MKIWSLDNAFESLSSSSESNARYSQSKQISHFLLPIDVTVQEQYRQIK